MNIIKKLRASIRLNEAVVQADKAHYAHWKEW